MPPAGTQVHLLMKGTRMSELISKVTEANFQTEVLESNIPVLIDFWADWCGPCLALTPTLEEIAKERQGKIKIVKINVEDEPGLASQFNIRNIPFLAFVRNGQKVADLVGLQPKQTLLKAIDAVVSQ
jgi:thioredoxin 1